MRLRVSWAGSSLAQRFVSRRGLWAATVGAGLCAGVGGYTFHYAKGLSYLSDDPVVCVNCHVMQAQYDGWVKASHHSVATCNDCHTPDHFIGKYWTKAENGFHHSRAFTLQNFHEPIRIRAKNSRILQRNCLRCHADMVSEMVEYAGGRTGEPDCVRCHAGAGHAPRN